MAKPGSDGARDLSRLAAMSRQATMVDRDMPEALKAQMIEQIEGQLGLRCGGCRRRVKVGFEFTAIDVAIVDGQPAADVRKLTACNREDCDFAEQCKDRGSYVDMVEHAWLIEVDEQRPEREMHGFDPQTGKPIGPVDENGGTFTPAPGAERMTHCPGCGCELAPTDGAGIPIAAEHAEGCTIPVSNGGGIERVEEGEEFPEAPKAE